MPNNASDVTRATSSNLFGLCFPALSPTGLTVGHIFYLRGTWGMLELEHPTATPSSTR